MLKVMANNILKYIPDIYLHQIKHMIVLKKIPNFKNPIGFNEKIMKRKIYPRSIYTTLSDKYKVRNFISSLWGKEYLIDLYAHDTELSYELFQSLPDKFVMKANHGSGYNKLVFDKNKENFTDLYDLSRSWMDKSFYVQSREKHYKDIEPRILIERLLEVEGSAPNDIKCHCFNKEGETVIFIQVDYNRFTHHQRDIFDEDWNRTEIRICYPNSPLPASKPSQLDDILRLARMTSRFFSYVRVDFYQVGEKVYFGELTFTPGAGLEPLMPKIVELEWGGYFTDM
ncbi:ATP-grasp fold amidoligase family protein [Serratia quinivorans]|uniref:ATP-grasp fold amidoligase family protein n=1 Tax=Serratia quinivorans TaxID=137545 RepID=UPI001C444AFD|nr:ATP-grasp fold amidoligase family protein [Serratia quinivorans]MBV6693115.1 glycosyltransferase [Serratia quinivorans]